ncbi:hypothetical protein ES705_30115 [subsurface metagenome]
MFKEKNFKISRTSIMIMFLCLSIIIISLSITLSSQYLIPGDNWRGFKYAYYIGQPYTTPYTKFYGGYTLYWSYISFSISVLTGLPVLNANVILFPFLYLFVCSIYLFCKALMRTFKSTISLLATISIVTFSGLFYFYNSNLAIHSKLLAIGIFQFSFHSFAFICLFCSLALFITISDPYFKNSYKRKEKAVVILLTVILMFHSYIIYFLPFILGFSFIFIYTIFSKNKKYSYNILLKICRYFIILFVLFDFLSNFYFSLVPVNYSHYFFGTPQPQISNRNVLYYNGLIIYFLLIISYFFLYGIYFLDIKLLSFLKLRNGKKIKLLLIIVLGIYSILLELEIFLNLILKESQNFFLFSLNNTFINIGIIGILGIYFSYLLYKVNRRLYKILAVWLCFILILSFSLIIYNWIKYYNFLPYEIPNEDYYYMRYWFTRTWYISILPLSIFFSIGLVKILNGINENRKYKDKNISGKLLLKLGITSILIILALSNTIFSGIYWTDKGTGNSNKPVYINDEEANIMGWVSKNIPSESNILIDRYLLYHLIDIAFCPTYYIWDELKKAEENYNGWYSEYNTYPNCNLELTEDLDGKNKILSFYDEKYAKKVISLIYDWIKSNPIGYNTSWMDGLEVSMRLIAWIYTLNFIKGYLLKHSTLFFKIYKSMIYHFFYIRINFEKYACNHTIGQIFAIYLFSKFSSSIEFFKKIYNKTRKKFLFYVNQQINSDGMHFEFSINYHRFVLEFCLIFNLLEKKYLKNSHLKLFNKMLDILIFSINSENEIIQVGDSDDANAIPKAFFNFYDSNYFLELVSFGSFVLGRTFLNNFLKKNSPSLIFFFGKNGIKKFYEISENQNKELNKNYLYLEKTGYFFVRNGFKPKSNYLFFDMADFGLYGGHDHLDISNIIYSYHGNSILVDSGTYRYNVPLEIRNLYKGLKAHNVVEINDYKNSFSIGTYHWNNKPKILSREFLLNKGYKLKIKYKLYKNFEISREINANHNLDNLEIIDKIMNKNRKSIQKEIKIFLHFSKNNELHIENNQIICNNQLKLYFNINDQITPNLIKGSYMQSKNYGQFQRSPLIIISFKYNFKPKQQFTFKINIATLK